MSQRCYPHPSPLPEGEGVPGRRRRGLSALLVDAAESFAGVLEAELQQELGCFELVPRCAAGRVTLHDGDDAADDAPAALSFLKDDALYGFPQPLVGFLFWCSLLQLSDHSEAMIAQMFGLSRGGEVRQGKEREGVQENIRDERHRNTTRRR